MPDGEICRPCWQLVVNHGLGKGGVGHVKLDTFPSTACMIMFIRNPPPLCYVLMPCIHCWKQFEPPLKQTKICSKECRRLRGVEQANMRYKPRGEARRECVQCGKTFKASHGTRKTCGKECAREYRLLRTRDWHKDAAKRKEDAVLRRRCSKILAAVPPGTMRGRWHGIRPQRTRIQAAAQDACGTAEGQKGVRQVREAIHDDPDAKDNMRQEMLQGPLECTEKDVARLALQEGKNMRPVREGSMRRMQVPLRTLREDFLQRLPPMEELHQVLPPVVHPPRRCHVRFVRGRPLLSQSLSLINEF